MSDETIINNAVEDNADNSRIDINDNNNKRLVLKENLFSWKRLLPRLFLFLVIATVSFLVSISLAQMVLNIRIPRTLNQVKSISIHLEELLKSSWYNYLSVTFVFSILYLWQQAFSIPGSVLLNLLGGYLYGITIGTLLTSLLTGFGATLAYGLSILVGEPFLRIPWVARKANQLIEQENKDVLFWWLLFLRLFPFTPYWLMNMVSPLLDIPLSPFIWSAILGSMPYNLICAQAGDVLNDLASTSDIFTISLAIKLFIVSSISLIPIIWGKSIQRWIQKWMGLNNKQIFNQGPEMELPISTFSKIPIHNQY